MANQVLLLNDQQVEDVDTLRGLNVSSEATFLLLRRAPLLSGAINRDELEHLLEAGLWRCGDIMWCCCGDEEHGVDKTCVLFAWKLDEAKDRIKVATYSKMPGVIPGCWLPLLPGQFGAGTGHCGLQ